MLWLAELGFIALLLACVASLLLASTTLFALIKHRQVLLPVREWSYAIFALIVLAFAILLLLFWRNDFSVLYVAQHGHRQLPPLMKVGALWGGHEGSLLLWLLCLSGWSACFALFSAKSERSVQPLPLAILALINGCFLIFILFFSDPFVRVFPPAVEGRDLNPMLQHIGLILHPPLLYLGYGGFAICSVLMLSSLLRGTFTAETARQCLLWAKPAWCFLTAGIILGSWWAYSELGWGGWWFWDPVENASLLPWLTASALLHSLAVSQRTGGLHHWSILLALGTFILSLLGTLIVRSGVLVSVHAFALDELRALPLFILFTFLSGASFLVYALRANRQQASTTKASPVLLGALLLFSSAALIVLVGTLYPMFYRLMGWGQISVGAPYFNLVLLPFGLFGLLLMCYGGFDRQRLPQCIAHAGVLLTALGIASSALQRHEISQNVSVGETVSLAGYEFKLRSVDLLAHPNFTSEQAIIDVSQQGKLVAQLMPERRFYTARRQQMFEPGIDWNAFHDWYVVMGEKSGEQRYAMRFYVQSGIRWIWWGGGLMIIGVLASGWQRRQACAG
ncbi:heme lyase NrfEFG subunit NrfE [Serratia sp. DD3]|uniref:heme lyase NrfEFG subunit NrfE n=1 Tax=Serratia sp. DD3 TaxID=1410619 RepID=UPI0003C51FEB|nr:heme lyase NrfEFG subunit NrfE [Serratia sp. DD3]KEY60262.1 cytochrome c-type biogenesis protein CcmF [Serratia sp. DD3]